MLVTAAAAAAACPPANFGRHRMSAPSAVLAAAASTITVAAIGIEWHTGLLPSTGAVAALAIGLIAGGAGAFAGRRWEPTPHRYH